jgi:hypothetical protein
MSMLRRPALRAWSSAVRRLDQIALLILMLSAIVSLFECMH